MPASGVFGKLNLREHPEIIVLNAPESFEPELGRLRGVAVRRDLSGARRVSFALAFVTRKVEVRFLTRSIPKVVEGDAVVWFAYPKGTSKRYACDFNRDTGWDALGAAGFEAVRQVAIDEDWTALRFRRVEFIKTLTRDIARTRSKVGRTRVAKKAR
ncbi:MAG TPA: hypothetical protein VN083_07055 [Vicinamibacteria bacterium]|jgi:hypothetical protein|nr:hypothetical protein [Vicinamibacteria bacterium]